MQNTDELRAKYAEWDSKIVRKGAELEITDVQGVRGFVTRSSDGKTYDVTSGTCLVISACRKHS